MAQYKTVAGPIELWARSTEDYETVVKKYAAIIDEQAVGGWELHLIQQIAVKRRIWYTLIIGAVIGALLGLVIVNTMMGGYRGPSVDDTITGLLFGTIVGTLFGCFGIKSVSEFFNMLVFVKHD